MERIRSKEYPPLLIQNPDPQHSYDEGTYRI